jgi:hypothetical protein
VSAVGFCGAVKKQADFFAGAAILVNALKSGSLAESIHKTVAARNCAAHFRWFVIDLISLTHIVMVFRPSLVAMRDREYNRFTAFRFSELPFLRGR